MGGDGDRRKKKPQSALADWGKVIGPYLQASALGVAGPPDCNSASELLRVNDGRATVHMKNPSQIGSGWGR